MDEERARRVTPPHVAGRSLSLGGPQLAGRRAVGRRLDAVKFAAVEGRNRQDPDALYLWQNPDVREKLRTGGAHGELLADGPRFARKARSGQIIALTHRGARGGDETAGLTVAGRVVRV